ncbi:PREDICTED: uncharacterized protein LOC106815890 [Priapulus caudatus]|uniref:Uncharacterized protein LOC106815890 n=1 Tax=Priapulus caudatus TaxID=37621 RepID=A0ABM1EUN5_PRICU|nr:PREDICTED: uncharacterized protein LOC106815890 [Priapulus caudatus]
MADDIFAIETDDDFDDLTVKKTSIGLGAFVAVFIVITFIVVIVMKMRQSERGELKLPKNRPKTFSSYLKSPGKYRHLMSVQRDDEDDLAALTSSRSSSTHSNLSQLSGHRGRCADSNGSLSVSRTSSRHSIRSNEPFGLDDHVTAV